MAVCPASCPRTPLPTHVRSGGQLGWRGAAEPIHICIIDIGQLSGSGWVHQVVVDAWPRECSRIAGSRVRRNGRNGATSQWRLAPAAPPGFGAYRVLPRTRPQRPLRARPGAAKGLTGCGIMPRCASPFPGTKFPADGRLVRATVKRTATTRATSRRMITQRTPPGPWYCSSGVALRRRRLA